MNPIFSSFRPGLGLALCLSFLTPLSAEESNTIKFSNPATPGTLKVVLARGDVTIHGADVQDVTVSSETPRQNRPRKDGLRVLTEAATFDLSEKDNVVTIDAAADGWMGAPASFTVRVPRSTNVVISSSMGGDITIGGVSGDIEIKSLHGEVRLDDVSGGALVETMNGEIFATFRELREGKALSFTSMNGEVALRVPSNAKANVRLRTQNGTILTDFDEKTLVTKVESTSGHRKGRGNALPAELRDAVREAARASADAARQAAAAMREAAEAAREGLEEEGVHIAPGVPVPPVPPAIPTVSGGKLVTGALNGGGAEIAVTTMNGDVTLRQLDKS